MPYISVQIGRSWTSRGTKTFQRQTGDSDLHVIIMTYDTVNLMCHVALYPT